MSTPVTWLSYSDRQEQASGALEVLDGPAVAGPEQVGGYYIIEAESMEEAVEWARKGRFMRGSNEVREIADFQP